MFDFAILLVRCAVGRPWTALGAVALLTLLAGVGLKDVRLALDGHLLTPWDEPAVVRDYELRQEFHLGDPILVLLETGVPDGVFDHSFLQYLQQLSVSIQAMSIAGPGAVLSLATEASQRVYPGTLKFRPFLDPLPQTSEEMNRLRGEIKGIESIEDILITKDRSAVAIVVRAPVTAGEHERAELERTQLVDGIRTLVKERPVTGISTIAPHAKRRISIVGPPVVERELGATVLRDLLVLIPLSMTLLAAAMWVAFKRSVVVGIVLLKAAASIVFVFGLIGWAGHPIEITTAIVPVILTCISVSDEVFILACYQRLFQGSSAPKDELAIATMREMVQPATITSAMMAVGFLSFVFSPIRPVATFGAVCAIGVLFCWMWSMVVTPAFLAISGPQRLTTECTGNVRERFPRRIIIWAIQSSLNKPKTALASIFVVTAVLGLGIARLEVQDSWTESLARDSPLRIDTQHADELFAGTSTLLVYLIWPSGGQSWPSTMHRNGPLLDPQVLEAVDAFEAELRKIPSVGKVIGPASEMKSAHFVYTAGQYGSHSIPMTLPAVADVLGSIEIARGLNRRQEVISDDLHRGAIAVLVRSANYVDTASIIENVRLLKEKYIAPLGATIDFGGDLNNSQLMIPAIVSTQLQSLALSVVGLFVVVALFTQSFMFSALAITPSCLAVIGLLGAMGILGVHLGVATSMICAMSLGIGADFGVYYLFRSDGDGKFNSKVWSKGRNDGTSNTTASLLERASRLSVPILTDTAAVACGFGLLGLSRIPANATLGLSVAFTVTACAIFSLVGIGAIIALLKARST